MPVVGRVGGLYERLGMRPWASVSGTCREGLWLWHLVVVLCAIAGFCGGAWSIREAEGWSEGVFTLKVVQCLDKIKSVRKGITFCERAVIFLV